MDKMKERNRMTLRAFMLKKNCPLEFIKIDKRDCGVFLCGDTKGYVSAKVMNAVNSNALQIDSVDYAECAKEEGGTYVPCLMIRSTANVVKTIPLKDLE